MSTIESLKKARTPEQLANQIEPMAQALATLAQTATDQIEQYSHESQAQSKAWTDSQIKTAKEWETAAKNLQEAAQDLTQATNSAFSLLRHQQLMTVLISLMSSMIAIAVLMIGFWLWLNPTLFSEKGFLWIALRIDG